MLNYMGVGAIYRVNSFIHFQKLGIMKHKAMDIRGDSDIFVHNSKFAREELGRAMKHCCTGVAWG